MKPQGAWWGDDHLTPPRFPPRPREERRSPIGLLAPLRNRDFALLWLGIGVSLLGDGIYFVAIAWEALRLSDTAASVSVVGVAWTLPTVGLLVFGGGFTDRLDRRGVMLCAMLGQAAVMAAIGLLSALGGLELWLLAMLVALYGGLQAFFLPAFEAIVPTLVRADELAHASALDQFVRPLTLLLVGPAIGGILIATAGTGAAFLLDAATFAFAALMLAAMSRPRRLRAGGGQAQGYLQGLTEGLGFVRANPWLWRTLLAAAVTLLVFVGPSQVLLPYLVKNELHAGSGTLGLIRGLGGAGALIAAVTLSQRGLPSRAVSVMFGGWAIQCLVLVGYALAADAWVFACVAGLAGAGGAIGNIIWGTLMKTRVPNQLLGRVASLDWLVSLGLVPLSFALTAPLVGAVGAEATLLGGGVVAAAVLLVAGLLPDRAQQWRAQESFSTKMVDRTDRDRRRPPRDPARTPPEGNCARAQADGSLSEPADAAGARRAAAGSGRSQCREHR